MSAGGVAGLIAAGALLILVLFVAVPLMKLGNMIDSGTRRVEQSAKIIDEAVERLRQTGDTVEAVNANLQHVESVTANVESISKNVSALIGLFGATLGSPVIRVAAFSYGVRKAVRKRQLADLEDELKDRTRAERAARKAGKADPVA
jgi:uncharacterized protein YoxC